MITAQLGYQSVSIPEFFRSFASQHGSRRMLSHQIVNFHSNPALFGFDSRFHEVPSQGLPELVILILSQSLFETPDPNSNESLICPDLPICYPFMKPNILPQRFSFVSLSEE
jgi:hypothetical protein